jgi:TRAP-type C4-dicarboxylate transport system permease small subunit
VPEPYGAAGPRRSILRGIAAAVTAARLACGLSFAAFCLVTFIQVVNRYLLGLPAFWTEELVLLLFVWSVMLGVPATLWQREEIVVDIVRMRAGSPPERLRRLAVDTCSIVFLAVLAYAGLQFADRGGISMSPALGLSRAWFYASIPIGAALGVLALVGRLLGGSSAPTVPPGPPDAALAHD